MIYCNFEKRSERDVSLRHVTVDAIALNKERNKILLVKRAPSMPTPNKWVLPGGYLDRDENIIKGVLRELLEETGCIGVVISLFRINDNPNRAGEDTQNVDFVYLVEVGEKTGKSDGEASEVKWFPLDEIPPFSEFGFDHYETIGLYLKYMKKASSLPIFG
jgi:ADP-ribose pyrophosphatase YjhB (NUDIX family)